MYTLRKKHIPMLLALLFCISCITSSSKESDLFKEFNTIITIHYKNEADKKFTKFQQYDEFFLNTYGIVEGPAHITEDGKLKTTIKLNLDKPTLLLLGFDELYIEPNDSLDIDYLVLKQSKTEFKDSIKINHGVGIITLQHGERAFLNKAFANQLKTVSNKAEIEHLVNGKTLNKEVENSFKKLYSLYPAYRDSINVRNYFHTYFKQYYFSTLTYKLNIGLKIMSNDIKSFTIPRIQRLSISLSQTPDVKLRTYWYGMNKVFEQILNPEFRNTLYSYQLIKPMIKNYDSTTQQFFLLLSIKAINSAEDDLISKNDVVQNNLNELIEHITNPKFISYIEKFKNGNSTAGFINDDIRKYTLLDFNMQPISFDAIFKNSSQKYLYLDFCGTWCKPCMEEIKQYSVHKKFESSAILKPIWLFFENNKTDWIKAIDKYNLKKENCFLVINDSILMKNFGLLFSWRGEFPHHFLFTNKGKIINPSAEALVNFDENKIGK